MGSIDSTTGEMTAKNVANLQLSTLYLSTANTPTNLSIPLSRNWLKLLYILSWEGAFEGDFILIIYLIVSHGAPIVFYLRFGNSAATLAHVR